MKFNTHLKRALPGTEAFINYQFDPTFPKKLTECFEDVLNYRDSLDYGKLNENQKIKYRFEKVKTYVIEKFAPKLLNVCNEYTGLPFYSLRLTTSGTANAMITMYTTSKATKDVPIRPYVMLQKGRGFIEPVKNLESMASIINTFEQSKSTDGIQFSQTKEFKEVCEKIGLSFDLELDIVFCFLTTDLYKSAEKEDIITPEELTAIYLHEIGHAYTNIQSFINRYFTIDRLVTQFHSLINNADIETMGKTLQSVSPAFTKMKSMGLLSNKEYTIISNALETVTYFASKEKKESSSWVDDAFVLIYAITKSITQLILGYITNYIINVSCYGIFNNIENETSRNLNESKTSDVFSTLHVLQNDEKSADDFAVKCGYGAQLISGLTKLNSHIYNSSYVARANYKHYSDIARMAFKFLAYVDAYTGEYATSLMTSQTVYEKTIDRYESMMKNLIKAFKASTDSKEEIDIFVMNYENMKKEINNYKKSYAYKAETATWRFLEVCGFSVTFISAILTGRLTNDYYKYQQQIDNLINNKLYYLSRKFKSMSF
jgi:hypothetical protein|nr:MAG TPA: peptidase [Caudoviricetes sp.]